MSNLSNLREKFIDLKPNLLNKLNLDNLSKRSKSIDQNFKLDYV